MYAIQPAMGYILSIFKHILIGYLNTGYLFVYIVNNVIVNVNVTFFAEFPCQMESVAICRDRIRDSCVLSYKFGKKKIYYAW